MIDRDVGEVRMSLDPTVLDASAINQAGEFEMLLFYDEEWGRF
jgi:hypothetical protein